MAVGRVGERLQLSKAGDAAFKRVVALDDPILLDGQLGRIHRSAEVVFARDGRMELVRSCEEAQFAVARVD